MRWGGLVLGLATCGLVGHAAPARSQEARPPGDGSAARSAAILRPDTVRVGEPFILGLSVTASRDAEVDFPALIALDPPLDQLRPPRVRWDGSGGGAWRVRYRVVAWKEGSWAIPPVVVRVGDAPVELRPPPIEVTSVLPAAAEVPLQLEPPRGPIPVRPFPWWLLLLLLAAVLLWWSLRRLRREDRVEEEPVDPAVAAREALALLKARLEGGELELALFYDGLEETVRRYLAARRGWSEVRPVRDFVQLRRERDDVRELTRAIVAMENRAGLVRFAHLTASREAALADADTCLAWVESEEAA